MARTADEQRRVELLELIVDYVIENGLSDLSLRPLADAVGSSARVLLYYFGSKDRLVTALLTAAACCPCPAGLVFWAGGVSGVSVADAAEALLA